MWDTLFHIAVVLLLLIISRTAYVTALNTKRFAENTAIQLGHVLTELRKRDR